MANKTNGPEGPAEIQQNKKGWTNIRPVPPDRQKEGVAALQLLLWLDENF